MASKSLKQMLLGLMLLLFSFVVWVALPRLAPGGDPFYSIIVLAIALSGLWLGVVGYRRAD